MYFVDYIGFYCILFSIITPFLAMGWQGAVGSGEDTSHVLDVFPEDAGAEIPDPLEGVYIARGVAVEGKEADGVG